MGCFSAPVIAATDALAATAPADIYGATALGAGALDAGAVGAADLGAGALAGGVGDAALTGADAGFNAGADALAGGFTGEAGAGAGDAALNGSGALPWLSQPGYDASAANAIQPGSALANADQASPAWQNAMNNNLPGQTSALNSPLQAVQQMAQSGGQQGKPGQPMSYLSTLAQLAPLINTLAGGTKYPGTTSQKTIAANQATQNANQQELNTGFENALNAGSKNAPYRTQTNPVSAADYYTYGSRPAQNFFTPGAPITFPTVQTTPLQAMKAGGQPAANPNAGGSGGQDDNVAANLSTGEYVVPADVVSALGDGNTDGGAKAIDGMIKKVRGHKASKGTSLPPTAKSPLQYMAFGGLASPSRINLGKAKYVGA